MKYFYCDALKWSLWSSFPLSSDVFSYGVKNFLPGMENTSVELVCDWWKRQEVNYYFAEMA